MTRTVLLRAGMLALVLVLSAPSAVQALSCADAYVSTSTNQFAPSLFRQNVYEVVPPLGPYTPGFLPAGVNLDALDLLENGVLLFSVDRAALVTHAGGTLFINDTDAYLYDPLTGVIELGVDYASRGVTGVDAITASGSYFSVSRSQVVTGCDGLPLFLKPSVVYVASFGVSGPCALPFADAATVGIPDIDALEIDFDLGEIWASSSSNVFGPGGVIRQEDMVVVFGGPPVVRFRGALQSLRSLDAFSGHERTILTALPVLGQTDPVDTPYVDDVDFLMMNLSGFGAVLDTPVTPVDIASADSGCEFADFAGFPAGDIALVRRGVCFFEVKALNAVAAGASALIVFNDDPGLPGTTLLTRQAIPVLFTTESTGLDLAGGTRADVIVSGEDCLDP